MNDNSELLRTTAQVIHVRRVGGEVLHSISTALYLAAGTVAVLMVLVWFRSAADATADFPGRYLFACLPLAVAGFHLRASAERVKQDL
jgi:hypothetical protein